MCHDFVIRRFAGTFVILSIVLGWTVSPLWFLFTAFVGVNLLQSSFTNFCPLEKVLARFGLFGCNTSVTAPEGT
jgi:hypothetical protein